MYITDATVTKGKPGDFGTCERTRFERSTCPETGQPITLTRLCGKPASRWLEGFTGYSDGSDWWELSLCSQSHRELVADEERSLAELEALLDEIGES